MTTLSFVRRCRLQLQLQRAAAEAIRSQGQIRNREQSHPAKAALSAPRRAATPLQGHTCVLLPDTNLALVAFNQPTLLTLHLMNKQVD